VSDEGVGGGLGQLAGLGGGRDGAPPSRLLSAHRAKHSRVQGVLDEPEAPYVRLRLRDSESTRAMLDAAFELHYEVVLGARQLELKLSVRNTGDRPLPFNASLLSHIGVTDVHHRNVALLARPLAAAQAHRSRIDQGLQNARVVSQYDGAELAPETAVVRRIWRVLAAMPSAPSLPR